MQCERVFDGKYSVSIIAAVCQSESHKNQKNTRLLMENGKLKIPQTINPKQKM